MIYVGGMGYTVSFVLRICGENNQTNSISVLYAYLLLAFIPILLSLMVDENWYYAFHILTVSALTY